MHKRHVNIPLFIPHLGCPNNCIFCNQKKISGKQDFDPLQADADIRSALATVDPSSETEIAFFGGSFTGIDRDLMLFLLQTASRYVEDGRVSSIRLSTRPDYIDEEILDLLKKHHVTNIELGIQSFSDPVLNACQRGHTAKDSERACRLIKAYGFSLTGQMMTALPASKPNDEIETAERMISLGIDAARIYPLVVFADTPLCGMLQSGAYRPPEREEAIARAGEVLDVLAKASVPVIRIGLQQSDSLSDPSIAVGGYYSPALGEEVMSYVYGKRLQEAVGERDIRGKALVIACPPGERSKVIGHKKSNADRLTSLYGASSLSFTEDPRLPLYTVEIDIR